MEVRRYFENKRSRLELEPYEVFTPTYFTLLTSNFTSSNFFFIFLNFYDSRFTCNDCFLRKRSNIFKYAVENDEKKLLPVFPLFNSYDHASFLDEFFYLRRSTFINFFVENQIDVPICFRKSKSLKRKITELTFLKFSNLLMKKGKREKVVSILFKTIRDLYKFFKQNNSTVIDQTND
jgi:hypothetical protein